MTVIDPIPSQQRSAPQTLSGVPAASWSLLGRLSPFGLMLGLWSIAALTDLVIAVMGGATLATVARVACTYLCGFGLSTAAYGMNARSTDDPVKFSFIRIVLIAVPSGSILFVVDVFARALAHGQSPFHVWPTEYFLRLRPSWAYFTMLFVFQSTVSWLMASAQAFQQHERRLLDARLAALRLQINPHFLFNTLSAIATLAHEAEACEAERMIDHLASFLRVTLAVESAVLVPLATEIDITESYLAIEHVRFGDRLAIRYECDSGLTEALVPSLVLQPLVENAIKHAVAPSKERVTVSIAARVEAGVLILRVEDDGAETRPPAAAGPGIGLKNVAARLQALYGVEARIETRRGAPGFAAILHLPLRFDSSASIAV